jgi:hypothetical protein
MEDNIDYPEDIAEVIKGLQGIKVSKSALP